MNGDDVATVGSPVPHAPRPPVGRLAAVLGLTMALGTLSQFVLGALGPRIIGDLAIGRAAQVNKPGYGRRLMEMLRAKKAGKGT